MSTDRLQGTDGIRRPVASSAPGETPQQAFLERNVITPEFLELYTFAYVSGLSGPCEAVIGWDPRDPDGMFTEAAVSGIRRAGATAVVVGICPTPAVALYLVWRGASAAFMVTASHNFRDQNGVKIFRGPDALKLFPEEDRALTQRVLALDHVRDVMARDPSGERIDAREEALAVFREFHLDPRNSWLKAGEALGDFALIVDPANGAMSGIAAEVLSECHGGDVIEVNHDVETGEVNRHSGVADLEGVTEIRREELRFREHRAIHEVFRQEGKAAVFDADGDRFYRLDYDPESDTIRVLSGDETAVHQARHLGASGALFVNTVESDLNAARAARALGYEPVLTGVGDKWVLRQATLAPDRYGIGSEETGHNISRGYLTTRAGDDVPVFLGNGLKSALNTFVATRGLSPLEAQRPFEPGFKRTLYVYYTKKELLRRGSPVFDGVREVLAHGLGGLDAVSALDLEEEPDMLYLTLGEQRAGIFVRNSGTEEKTGVNVRGRGEDAEVLVRIAEEAVVYLAETMKDRDHPMARAEKAVLEALGNGPIPGDALPVPEEVNRERLIGELANKEHVIAAGPGGYERTELGRRVLEAW